MKILYLTHRFPPEHFRGTEVYTLELAAEMLRRGHQALVVTLREMKDSGKLSVVNDVYRGVPVARIRKQLRPENFEDYFFDPAMDGLFKGMISDFRPDLVHAGYFLGGLSLGMSESAPAGKLIVTVTDYSALCCRGQLLDQELAPCPGPRSGVRCLRCLFNRDWLFSNPRLDSWAREHWPVWLGFKHPAELAMVRRRNQAAKKVLETSRTVIFAHPHTRAVFAGNGISIAGAKLLDFGIDVEPFKVHRKTASGRLRIGFIGQILPHKGLDLLVDALAGMKNQQLFELLIYGSLSDPAEKKYFDSLGLSRIQNQKWLGTFDLLQMNQILEGIDLLAMPSRWAENCPLMPKYALLTGTRLLISDAPGILLKSSLEGIDIFGINRVDQLRQKLQDLLASGAWRQRPAGAKNLVMSMTEHADSLELIYREAG